MSLADSDPERAVAIWMRAWPWVDGPRIRCMSSFGAVDRHEAVAIIDGASSPFTSRPRSAQFALDDARAHLGDQVYEDRKVEGARLTDSELADALRRAIDLTLG